MTAADLMRLEREYARGHAIGFEEGMRMAAQIALDISVRAHDAILQAATSRKPKERVTLDPDEVS